MPESVADQVIAVRQERSRRGAAMCRAALDAAATKRRTANTAQNPAVVLSGSDLLLARAQQRAAKERRRE